MKLGIVGKGGTGKTTVAALLAGAYRQRGLRVVAVDTDSNPNLGVSLGLSFEEADAVPTLPRAAVVGNGDGETSPGQLLDEYGRVTASGVTLLTAMRVDEAGAGCTCGQHATVRSLLGEAIDKAVDVTVVDMEAGLEHLSRSGGTLAYSDLLLVVMEPSRKSVITAARTAALADELGIPRVYGLGNKARGDEDVAFLRSATAAEGIALAGVLPYEPQIVTTDRSGDAIVTAALGAVRDEIERLIDALEAGDVEPAPAV